MPEARIELEVESCRRFEVRGRVQGVGFRYFARRAARRLGLRGWVRNCSDGTVESLALGTSAQLESFEEALGVGPSGSRVRSVTASVCEAEAELGDSFEIVY